MILAIFERYAAASHHSQILYLAEHEEAGAFCFALIHLYTC
jgi:hypothetical protein